MLFPAGHEIRVRRLHQRPGARRFAENELRTARAPSRLASDAVLCIQRMCIQPNSADLEAEMADAMHSAARPAREPVPAGGNAVLFADQAELLACLARDWCRGEAAACWWWRTLFPKREIAAVVREAWLANVSAVPGALARIESAGLAARFLGMLSQDDLALLWREVVRTFALSALDAAWDGLRESAPDFQIAEAGPEIADDASPPWSRWIGALPQLREPGRRLLVSALMLVRAPAVVRSIAFARAVACRRTAKAPGNARVPRAGDGVPPSRTFDGARSVPTPIDQTHTERSSLRRNAATGTRDAYAPRNEADAPLERPTKDAPQRLENDATFSLPPTDIPECVASEWGGLFYLVNVALALGYYGDFTTPAQPGLALPLWDFLALLGARMIGDEFATDPLFTLLARLSRRDESEPAGACFELPDGEPLARWLDRTAAEIDVRLTAALGVVEVVAMHALVFRHRVEIETTAARVDVHFSLAAHPIALRLAGLDRDPGWVPAGARSLAFHYD